MRPTKLNQNQCDALVIDNQAGMTTPELCTKYGVGRGAVLRALRSRGIQRAGNMMDEKVDEIHALHRDGATLRQLGIKYGCHAATIKSTFIRAGLPVLKNEWVRNAGCTGFTGMDDAQIMSILGEYLAGESAEEVGSRHGMAATTVLDELKSRGYTPRPVGPKSAVHRARATLYGLTLEQMHYLVETKPVCEVCGAGALDRRNNGNSKLCIDHDHETDQVRGVLCASCNIALGNMHDNTDFLLNMAEYVSSREGVSSADIPELMSDGTVKALVADNTPDGLDGVDPEVLKAEYYASGFSVIQLARKYGSTYNRANALLKRANTVFKKQGTSGPRPEQALFSEQQQQDLIAAAKSGMRRKELAEMFSTTPTTIAKYAIRLGLTLEGSRGAYSKG